MFNRKMRTGIVFSLVLAFVVMVSIAFYADAPRMLVVLSYFHWQYLPLVLGFTLFNYFGRFIKWQYYLKRLNIKVAWFTSLLIFVSGLSMAITPGKVGELLKSYQLKQVTGTEISRTAPIIVCERLTDGIAMIGLASMGLLLYRFGWEVLLLLLFIGLTSIILIQSRSLALRLLTYAESLPILSRFAPGIRTFYESSYTLLQWQPLLLAIGIGFVSWSGECVALYFVYRGLGVAATNDLSIKVPFILAVSSLIGSASGLPGGLGTADGSMLGLTHLLISPSATFGGAATVLIRLCTLWFGLLLGLTAVLTFRATQRGSTTTQLEDGQEAQKQKYILAMDERLSARASASTSAHTGEKAV